MGKATILGEGARNLPRGKYRVRVEKDNTRAIQELKRIDSELSSLDSITTQRNVSYIDSEKAYNSAKLDLDLIIQQSRESDEDYADRLTSATNAVRAASDDMLSAKSSYQAARLKERSLQGKKLYLNDLIGTDDIREVWCADCQRELSGSVATIEIPNTDDAIMIRPGGGDGSGSVYSSTRDGQLRSVAAMSPAEAAWNYIMFPAWQKWKPLYRLGKITERIPNNSKCSVLLDAYSTAQGLDTDVERQLSNVPMIYKGRDDGGPYIVGDRVVVEFHNQNWESPRVIGFEREPCTTSSSTTTTTEIPIQTFYIRFRLNSCTPDHGGYEIKLTCDDADYLYGYSHQADNELVGPFTVTDGCSPYAHIGDRWMFYSAWGPSAAYSAGNYVHTRRAYEDRSFVYKCVQTGISGDTEPSWPFDASIVDDNSCKWEFQGFVGTGFYFFWHWTLTDAFDTDPDVHPIEVKISTTQTYNGMNNHHLWMPKTGSVYIKPVRYKRHSTPVFDCASSTEVIDGEDATVYTMDFTDLKYLHAYITGQRIGHCQLGDPSELTTDLGFDSINFAVTGARWMEEMARLPRKSDVFPYWQPNLYHESYPGILCEVDPLCGNVYAYGGYGSYSVDSIITVTPGADINHTYAVLTDEYGCTPSYPGFEMTIGHGRNGTWVREKYVEPGCTHDDVTDSSSPYYNDTITVTLLMEDVPCGHFVPPHLRVP